MTDQGNSRDIEEEAPGEAAMRVQFPGLYITLVSIVVALAVEGLLGRMRELTADLAGPQLAVFVLQVAHFIYTAGVFWWISARWVTTSPWKFGLIDGLSMIMLLMAFHFVSRSIGEPIEEWMLTFGVLAVASSIFYRFNGRRGIKHCGRSVEVARQHLVPTFTAAAVGIAVIIAWIFVRGTEPGIATQTLIVGMAFAGTIIFGVTDYRVWSKVSAEPSRFD